MTQSSYHYRAHEAEPGQRLLIVFHGTGGDENQFFGYGRQLLPDAGIVAPRGDVSEHGALRFFRRTGEGVYDMDDLRARTAAMARFVEDRIEQARPSRIIGLGYSNGANILASVILSRPELFDEAVLMHPLIPWQPEPNAGLAGRRMLITAGRNDPICPPSTTQLLADYLVGQKADVELFWHSGGHEIQQGEIAAVGRFIGDGP